MRIRMPPAALLATPVLLVVLLGCWSPTATGSEDGADLVSVPLCLGCNIYAEVPPQAGGKAVMDVGYLRNAAAAAMAVRDINNLNCTIYGPGCADIVSWEGGRVQLNATLFDTQTFAPTVGPVLVSMCNNIVGGQAIVTSMGSSQTESAALMGAHFGLPQISGIINTPELSNTDFYPYFGRLVLSSQQLAHAMAAFISHMRWRQVALVHISDSFGQSYAEVFFPMATRLDFKATSFAVGSSSDVTIEAVRPALQRLQESGIKVIHLAMPVKQTTDFLLLAHELGFPVKEYVWLNQITLWAVQGMLSIVPDDKKPILRDMMEGFLSLSIRYPYDVDKTRQWTDSIATLDLSVMSGILRNSNGDLDPRLAPSTFALLSNPDTFWEPELNTYDAVWAVAAAFAAVHRNGGGSSAQGDDAAEAETPGVAAFRQITSGAVSFSGISGSVSFDERGERELSDVTLNVLNLVTLPNNVTFPPVIVGHITFDGNKSTVQLDEYPPIRWPDGSAYPTVPSDGLENDANIVPIIVPTGVALGLLAFVTLWLVHRNNRLRNRVHNLTKMEEIDIESPLAKMLDFLRRYKDATLLRVPGRHEAAMLYDLICHHNGSLAAPDLMQQLKGSPHLADHFMKHLIQTTGGGHLGFGQMTPASSLNSSFNSSGGGMGDDSETDGELADESQRSIASVGRRILAAYSKEDALISGTSVPLIESITLKASQVEIPPRLVGVVGRDYFMDFVTSKSHVRGCPSPLALVAKCSIECLGVQDVLGPDGERKLTNYAAQIESGYPTTGYHCQQHAADVTNRVVALMICSGIAQGDKEDDAPWMLATLTAAMMHDYDHPHLNNQYLVALGFDIAKDFNDQAVAENHSLKHGLAIMEHGELDFISDWSRSMRQQLRSIVIQAVLATDMSRHFELLTQFQAKVADASELSDLSGRRKWEAMDHSQKVLTIQIAMKVSDIGACALPIEQHMVWNSRLQEEFFKQGDREKGHGLPPSFLMDRRKPGVQNGKNQAGFFKFIVLPLMSAWVKVFPECQPLLTQAHANHKHWETVASTGSEVAGREGQKLLKEDGM